jgi:hypothetical protein
MKLNTDNADISGGGIGAEEDLLDKEFWQQTKILNKFEDVYDPSSQFYKQNKQKINLLKGNIRTRDI